MHGGRGGVGGCGLAMEWRAGQTQLWLGRRWAGPGRGNTVVLRTGAEATATAERLAKTSAAAERHGYWLAAQMLSLAGLRLFHQTTDQYQVRRFRCFASEAGLHGPRRRRIQRVSPGWRSGRAPSVRSPPPGSPRLAGELPPAPSPPTQPALASNDHPVPSTASRWSSGQLVRLGSGYVPHNRWVGRWEPG